MVDGSNAFRCPIHLHEGHGKFGEVPNHKWEAVERAFMI
jgi:hypothetical protein